MKGSEKLNHCWLSISSFVPWSKMPPTSFLCGLCDQIPTTNCSSTADDSPAKAATESNSLRDASFGRCPDPICPSLLSGACKHSQRLNRYEDCRHRWEENQALRQFQFFSRRALALGQNGGCCYVASGEPIATCSLWFGCPSTRIDLWFVCPSCWLLVWRSWLQPVCRCFWSDPKYCIASPIKGSQPSSVPALWIFVAP